MATSHSLSELTDTLGSPPACQLAAVCLISAADADVAGCCTVAQHTSNWGCEDGGSGGSGRPGWNNRDAVHLIHHFKNKKTPLPAAHSPLEGFYWSASLRNWWADGFLNLPGIMTSAYLFLSESMEFEFQSLGVAFGMTAVHRRWAHLLWHSSLWMPVVDVVTALLANGLHSQSDVKITPVLKVCDRLGRGRGWRRRTIVGISVDGELSDCFWLQVVLI